VRARFSAFALGLLPFVRATEAKSRATIVRIDPRTRYKRLMLLDAAPDPVHPRVLFAVDVLHAGSDASFLELSTFAREQGRWVYESGVARRKRYGIDPVSLDIPTFEASV
jgi:SEC-C motif-containing protein